MKRLFFLAFLAAPVLAHVGSPDVFYEGHAGPYPVFITIRPPSVVPGIAEVEIRIPASGIQEVDVVPFPLVGPASKLPPVPDIAKRSSADPQFYTSSVWFMAFGSYQVRVTVKGDGGAASVSVPIPSIARETKSMQTTLGLGLFALLLLLCAGAVAIAGAAARESTLPPGVPAPDCRRRLSWFVMAAAAVAITGVVAGGSWWWSAEAADYRANVYQPLGMSPELAGSRLTLRLSDPGWLRSRRLTDFIPDHHHLMHLFLVRTPALDRMWHLHPDETGDGVFTVDLPTAPKGRYRLFADLVHASGFPETAVAEITLPAVAGRPLAGDDSDASARPVGQELRTSAPLADGFRMIWDRPSRPLRAKAAERFTFRVLDSNGQPARDLQPYMGMPGHAEFLSADGSVFAHVHPSGTAPMAALDLAQPMPSMNAMGGMEGMHLPPEVSFPYGFPKPGLYRIFVQIQRADRPQTGVFDVHVE